MSHTPMVMLFLVQLIRVKLQGGLELFSFRVNIEKGLHNVLPVTKSISQDLYVWASIGAAISCVERPFECPSSTCAT